MSGTEQPRITRARTADQPTTIRGLLSESFQLDESASSPERTSTSCAGTVNVNGVGITFRSKAPARQERNAEQPSIARAKTSEQPFELGSTILSRRGLRRMDLAGALATPARSLSSQNRQKTSSKDVPCYLLQRNRRSPASANFSPGKPLLDGSLSDGELSPSNFGNTAQNWALETPDLSPLYRAQPRHIDFGPALHRLYSHTGDPSDTSPQHVPVQPAPLLTREELAKICAPFFEQMLTAVEAALQLRQTNVPKATSAPGTVANSTSFMNPPQVKIKEPDAGAYRSQPVLSANPSMTHADVDERFEVSNKRDRLLSNKSSEKNFVDLGVGMVIETSSASELGGRSGLGNLVDMTKSARAEDPARRGSGSSAAVSSKPSKVCCHWKNKGWCRYKENCKFFHPEEERGSGLPNAGKGEALAACTDAGDAAQQKVVVSPGPEHVGIRLDAFDAGQQHFQQGFQMRSTPGTDMQPFYGAPRQANNVQVCGQVLDRRSSNGSNAGEYLASLAPPMTSNHMRMNSNCSNSGAPMGQMPQNIDRRTSVASSQGAETISLNDAVPCGGVAGGPGFPPPVVMFPGYYGLAVSHGQLNLSQAIPVGGSFNLTTS